MINYIKIKVLFCITRLRPEIIKNIKYSVLSVYLGFDEGGGEI